MSITDELREFASHCAGGMGGDALRDIADRIDERHEEIIYEYKREYEDFKSYRDIAYVKLPVDADGEIWTGNERVFEVGNGTRYDMRYLMYDGEKWIIDSSFGGFIANKCRHVQPDSWERIIEDALSECGWEQPKEYEIDFEDSKEQRDRFVAELVERCKRLAGE